MFSSQRPDGAARRTLKIKRGGEIFGFVEKSLGEIDSGDFLTFIYEADKAGTNKQTHLMENLYDANPFIYVLEAKRNKTDGRIIITGLNTNYLHFKREKARIVASLNILNRTQKSLYKRMIHTYRLDRVKSPLFKAVDVVADAMLLTSTADWQSIR